MPPVVIIEDDKKDPGLFGLGFADVLQRKVVLAGVSLSTKLDKSTSRPEQYCVCILFLSSGASGPALQPSLSTIVTAALLLALFTT